MSYTLSNLLGDRDILFIPPTKCSKQQTCKGEVMHQRRIETEPSGHKRISFWERLRRCLCSEDEPFLHHHVPCEVCEYFAPPPKVFVLHHKGQPIPLEWKGQVPPDMLLVAVEPGDWPGHNCFEARPVPLESLRQES